MMTIYVSDYDMQKFRGHSASDFDLNLIGKEVCKVQYLEHIIEHLEQNVMMLHRQIEKQKEEFSLMNNLIKIVNETPALQTEWERFICLVKLMSDPEQIANNK